MTPAVAAAALAMACASCSSTVIVNYSPRPLGDGPERRIVFAQRGVPGKARYATEAGKVEGRLIALFTKSPGFVVLERRETDAILRETAFSLSAIVDENSAVEAGRLLAADTIVLFQLTAVQTRFQRHEVHEYIDGHASGNAEMIDVETGRILAASREEAYVSVIERYSTYAEARDLLLRKLADQLAAALQAGGKPKTVPLKSTSHPQVRNGIRFAQEGLWEEAVAAWAKVVQAAPNDAAAHYNLGRGHEALGDPDQALEHLTLAAELDPSERLYLKALAEAKRAAAQHGKPGRAVPGRPAR